MKNIKNLCNIFFQKRKPTVLNVGRWNSLDNQGIKSILANSDHCGDKICKDPKITNAFIEKELDEYKKKKNIKAKLK